MLRREDFPDLHNIGFDEDRSKGKRADELISDIMNDELMRSERARFSKKREQRRAREKGQKT